MLLLDDQLSIWSHRDDLMYMTFWNPPPTKICLKTLDLVNKTTIWENMFFNFFQASNMQILEKKTTVWFSPSSSG